jgi:hypothetical protein
MGFGFNLFIFPILVIVFGAFLLYTIIRIIIALINKDRQTIIRLFKSWGIIGLIIIGIPLLFTVLKPLSSKMIVNENDTRGKYIINREMFSGKQADWQYNHFRFEITNNDKFLFHITENEKIIKTIEGHVTYHSPWESVRFKIHLNKSKHHILKYTPTLYRDIWSFYYVFHSEKFGNMFFKKGEWRQID